MRPAIFIAAWLASAAASAQPLQPEIKRPPATPQPIGKLHALRTIPEACTRIQGRFTGDAGKPYEFSVAALGGRCQPRARLVDAFKAKAGAGPGWVLNDLVVVPSAACPGQHAVLRIWRETLKMAPPKPDRQGTSRIYLKDGLDAARKGELNAIPSYAVDMGVVGKGCG